MGEVNNDNVNNAIPFSMAVSEYNLLNLLKKQTEISEVDFWKYVFIKFDDYIREIESKIKNFFPRLKSFDSYSDEFIASQIFKIEVSGKDLKSLHKYSCVAIRKTLYRLKDELNSRRELPYNSDFFKGQIVFMWNTIFNIQEYIETVESYYLKKNVRYHWSRRQVLSSEIDYLSRRILRSQFFFNDIAQAPVAVFLIRQSIELKIIEILGIKNINEKVDNSMIKVPADKLFPIFEKRSTDIILPIPYSIIKRIHKWTNLYVHRSKIYDYWEIEWAQHMLKPLFSEATKMRRSYKENDLINDIYVEIQDENKEKYNITFSNLQVEWID